MKKITTQKQAIVGLLSLALIVIAVFAGVFIVLKQRDFRRSAYQDGVEFYLNSTKTNLAVGETATIDVIFNPKPDNKFFVSGVDLYFQSSPNLKITAVHKVRNNDPLTGSTKPPYLFKDNLLPSGVQDNILTPYTTLIGPGLSLNQAHITLGSGTSSMISSSDAQDPTNPSIRILSIDVLATGLGPQTVSISPNSVALASNYNIPTSNPDPNATPNLTPNPTNIYTDINVIDDAVLNGNVVASFEVVNPAQPKLSIENLQPANPLDQASLATVDVFVDVPQPINNEYSGSIGYDAIINFTPSLVTTSTNDISINTNNVIGTSDYNPFYTDPNPSSNMITVDNTLGKLSIHGLIKNGSAPVFGKYRVASISFKTAPSQVGNVDLGFEFTGNSSDTNDSNIVTEGPKDILAQTSGLTLQIQDIPNIPTITPTPTNAPVPTPTLTPIPTTIPTPLPTGVPTPTITRTPTPTPTPVPTNTPTPTNTPLPTQTPTPIANTNVTLIPMFKNRSNLQDLAQSNVVLVAKNITTNIETSYSLKLSNTGSILFSIAPGEYEVKLKVDGFLARVYGKTSPIIISGNTSTVNLGTLSPHSNSPLLGGDFNQDGIINTTDYAQFLLNFGKRDSSITAKYIDLDGSSYINIFDFGILRTNWGLSDETF